MMKKLIKYVVLIAFFITPVNAEIIETNSLESFENAAETADQDTLVIFDVQEVLMVAKDQILSPLYKDDRALYRDKIIAKHTPAEQERLFSIILKEYQTKIVDQQLIKTLEDLKTKNVKAIALTSGYTGRYGVIDSREDLRIHRLKEIGIDFTGSFPHIKPTILLNLTGAKNQQAVPMFKDGIIFACRFDKGEVLKTFLKEINYKPKKIIFVDNKLKNIKSVESYCGEEGINFTGFHYNYIRSLPKITLNKKLADYKFNFLENKSAWLNDDHANSNLTKK